MTPSLHLEHPKALDECQVDGWKVRKAKPNLTLKRSLNSFWNCFLIFLLHGHSQIPQYHKINLQSWVTFKKHISTAWKIKIWLIFISFNFFEIYLHRFPPLFPIQTLSYLFKIFGLFPQCCYVHMFIFVHIPKYIRAPCSVWILLIAYTFPGLIIWYWITSQLMHNPVSFWKHELNRVNFLTQQTSPTPQKSPLSLIPVFFIPAKYLL